MRKRNFCRDDGFLSTRSFKQHIFQQGRLLIGSPAVFRLIGSRYIHCYPSQPSSYR
ncbi:hypothetical protein GA0061100_102560 [Rhizobium hainanense]|uniref:Uncharacterized protein n=1 Tax=Rhizobium hainanense TaxID=52131 RepID=A0A1C3ULC8_9HYPH|nr:hypothetical protein GA0061100_102560 [Rhizobium hainanense]